MTFSAPLSAFLRFNRFVQNVSGGLAGLSLLSLLALVCLSVITRVLGITATFAEEFTRYNIIVLFAFGAGYTLMKARQIATDSLLQLLSDRIRDILAILTGAVSLALFAVVLQSSYVMWSIAYAWKLRSGTDIAVPLWPVQFLVFLGFFLLTLQTLADMAEAIHRLAGRKGTGQAIET